MHDSITKADRAAFFASYAGRVYLLHFIDAETGISMGYKHARHYLGVADDLAARLAQHRNGTGARLTQVVKNAGISWVVARTWIGGRPLERRLKGYHSGVKLCPICQGKVRLADVVAEQALPMPRPAGQRKPMNGCMPLQFVSRVVD